MRITREDCLAALEPIRSLIEEGIQGSRHVGVHLVVMDAESGEYVLDYGFGYPGNADARQFRDIAIAKADVVREHGLSIREIRETNPDLIRDQRLHNGGEIENGIIVAAAGASPIGNMLIVRPVLDSLSKVALASLAA